MLGRPALDGLIRELVADEQWLPGVLHQKLVQLPWVDILTTNWDTLLERAAATTLGQTYETVRCLEDIATTQSPRVVKLHGSLPSGPFILSEEDYRKYPQKCAPFVNLVQQVLLENELCLLGFSGDDPNFLQWSGWVRDQLGASARRIYLVGALNLRTAQRRLLEQRNVAPIDLSPLVAEVEPSRRHKAATRIFLDRLHASRPKPSWDWGSRPVDSTWSYNDPATHVAASFAELATAWASARYSYPGWAVCPLSQRNYLEDSIHVLQRRDALAAMSRHDRARICFEAAWRVDTALLPIDGWLATLEILSCGTGLPGRTVSLRSGMFDHLKVVPITAAQRASNEEPLPCSRPATITAMPVRGLLAQGDMDQRQAIAEQLQPPACSTRKPGKLLHMPRRSPDDNCSA